MRLRSTGFRISHMQENIHLFLIYILSFLISIVSMFVEKVYSSLHIMNPIYGYLGQEMVQENMAVCRSLADHHPTNHRNHHSRLLHFQNCKQALRKAAKQALRKRRREEQKYDKGILAILSV